MSRIKLTVVALLAGFSLVAAVPSALATPARAGQLVRISGRIADFTATSLTIKTSGGDFKAVQLISATKYYVNGHEVDHQPQFEKGEPARVLAHQEADGSLTARIVSVRDLGAGMLRISGTIADFTAGSLTIKTSSGDFKAVQLNGATKYYVNGKEIDHRPDFKKGEAVRVRAHQELDGSLTALVVFLRTHS